MSQSDEFAVRRATVDELRASGVDPYPSRSHQTATIAAVQEALTQRDGDQVTVAGRLVGGLRPMGKLAFVHLHDGSGHIQLSIQRPLVGEDGWELFRKLHSGDFVEAAGETFHTQRGEPSVRVATLTLLSKTLRPLPEKYHGLEDNEARYRQRYLDLIANDDSRRTLILRSKMVSEMRRYLDAHDFLEVETPILQPLYGGAAAKPFTTHFNALDQDLYLRIALELYLKRLIIGGIDRVYEIGHNFRNEGFSRHHSPEYSMMEIYQAYADYTHMMALCENLVSHLAITLLGTTIITVNEHEIDLAPPWTRLSMLDAILQYSGIDVAALTSQVDLYTAATTAGVHVPPTTSRAKIIDQLVKDFVEPHLISPTHLTGHPVELSPLAKRQPDNPNLVERFESYIGGFEISNAFTELNDPIDQRIRFEEQQQDRDRGDEEAHSFDEDFLRAMEHGMPPTGGMGIGIDRLAMVLTGAKNIRDVIFFPPLRREED